MNQGNTSKPLLLDKFILGFVVLFIVSLTNSIFLNQIGYFVALLLILVRYFRTKENQFEKTGLEIAFILFLSIELISAIFSWNQAQAFQNFSKRLLLIPIVYVMIAASDSTEKTKLFFKIFIGAALLTISIYIVFAYEHFIAQLYRLESRGPSPFQYVMTAGGLMSFSVIILFAFVVNDKSKISLRLLYIILFGIASIALFASYTRAAWIGAAAGIIFILFIKRKWVLILLGSVILIIGFLYPKNVSKVFSYDVKNDDLKLVSEYSTNGRPFNLYSEGDTTIIADYEKGISIRVNDKEIQNIESVAPVTGIKKWQGNYFIGYLVDSRVLLLRKKDSGKFEQINEFTSPGRTMDYKDRNNKLYFADLDSGLTIYNSPKNIGDKTTIKRLSEIRNFDIDSSRFIGFDPIRNALFYHKVEDGVPGELIDSIKVNTGVGFIWILEKQIFFQSEKELSKYSIVNDKIVLTSSIPVTGIFKIHNDNGNYYCAAVDGNIYKLNIHSPKIEINKIHELGFSPYDFVIKNGKAHAALVKRNRITSVFDPYHDTNIERMEQWKTGWKILNDHPLIGVGDIDLKEVYSQYKNYYLKENFGHLHNNYVQFLVILGGVGFIIVMYMLVSIFRVNYNIYQKLNKIPFVSTYSLGALAAFVGFLVSGLAEWNFGDQEIITMVWFTVGLNLAFYKNHLKENKA